MYVKFTRLDGSPIWLNSAFVITIEPRRQGGSTVVPIGDGLDYDVRETPDQVLAMLANAPAPTVVPVPAPKGLTKTPNDVSPEPERPEPTPPAAAKPDAKPAAAEPAEPTEAKPARKTTRKTTRKAAASAEAEDGDATAKPRKTTRRTKKAKAEEEAAAEATVGGEGAAETVETATQGHVEDVGGEPRPAEETQEVAGIEDVAAAKPVEPPPENTAIPREPYAFPLSEDQLVRLRKLAPRSVRKLKNTLYSQFRISETEPLIGELEARGELTVDQQRIYWKMPF